MQLETCSCEPVPVTLLRHDLWSTTPVNPSVAVHIELMELGRLFQLEAHVSSLKFVDTICARSQNSKLNRVSWLIFISCICIIELNKNNQTIAYLLFFSCSNLQFNIFFPDGFVPWTYPTCNGRISLLQVQFGEARSQHYRLSVLLWQPGKKKIIWC